MFAYYVILGIMRFFLFKHTNKYKTNEQTIIEVEKSIICGWLLLVMNLALAIIVFFMVYWNKSFNYDMITTIALATYTFVTFTFAIINLVKFKKYKSPVYSSVNCIAFIAGCVSILTLENIMLTTFGTADTHLFRQIILSITGVVVIAVAIIVAIIMIINGKRKTTQLK
jgi:hypothetical protein